MPETELLYESQPSFRSLWQKYRIWRDYIELHCFFWRIRIFADEVEEVKVFPPPVIRTTFWALKLDLADLYLHVGIRRKTGLFKNLRFTPDDPERFCAVARSMLEAETRQATP